MDPTTQWDRCQGHVFKESMPEGCVIVATIFEKYNLPQQSLPWHTMPLPSAPSSTSCYHSARTPLEAGWPPCWAQKMPCSSQLERWSPVLLTFLDYSSLISRRIQVPGVSA